MAGRIANNIKYISVCSEHVESNTLVDRVVVTLRDIFWNGGNSDLILDANDIVKLIVKDELYMSGSRSDELVHKNIFNIHRVLRYTGENSIDFEDAPFEEDEIYVKFSDWLEELNSLKNEIKLLIDEKTK
jgi:hypothetical protein